MKQVVQSPRSGKLELVDVPAPALAPGSLLVRNHFSVVSPGTEKMALDFARKSILGKARSRPDLVRQVVQKVRQEGALSTYKAVTRRLDVPQPLGYSTAGVVEAVGEGVAGFVPGDRVACAGAGYANHAELVAVPENLVVLVPDSLSLDRAAFATLGAIAMQGLRVAGPSLGEIAAVIGLGLIGQLAVQLLRANGCRVLGVDLDDSRIEQAREQGAEWVSRPDADHAAWIAEAAGGYGADLALVTAASDSSAPIQLAAELCRIKGRVAVVGATAMELERRTFYEKELELRMSMSYGPGRYDRHYEELGLDYPISHVRWTENRNLQAFAHLAASGAIDPSRLNVEVVPFEDAESAYEELAGGARRALALLFRYDAAQADAARSLSLKPLDRVSKDEVGVAFIGAGNYATAMLLPALERVERVRKVSVVTATGPSARRTAERFAYANCGTDASSVLTNPQVDLVFVATQHDTHASLAEDALRAGKAVWLEKPAALDAQQLDRLAETVRETAGFLSLGYNRRFSPHARAIREHFEGSSGPLAIHYTVSAGPVPGGTWHTDPKVGGGRIIGEACHFVDLMLYLIGASPHVVYARALGRDPESDDSLVATLGFADGSTATLHYLARASTALAKERFEVSGRGKTATCDDFRETRFAGKRKLRTAGQDKGQATAVADVVEAVRAGRPSPFGLDEILAVSRATFAMHESTRSGEPAEVTA